LESQSQLRAYGLSTVKEFFYDEYCLKVKHFKMFLIEEAWKASDTGNFFKTPSQQPEKL